MSATTPTDRLPLYRLSRTELGPKPYVLAACQLLNDLPVLGKLCHQLRSLPDLKIGKIETRGYGASHQRPGFPIRYMRAEPAAGGHHSLRDLALFRIISDQQRPVDACRVDDMYPERRSGVEVPKFVRTQTVEGGKVFPFEEEINRSRGWARSGKSACKGFARKHQAGAIGLAVISALAMGFELEILDPIAGVRRMVGRTNRLSQHRGRS